MRTCRARISGDLVVVGGNGSAFAISAEILRGIKAERGHIADASNAAPPVARAVRLRGVFEDADAMALGYGANWVHIHGAAIEMHRKNGACARSDGALHKFRIEIAGGGVD